MNNTSPFSPQTPGSDPKNTSRQRVRFAVFCILSVHIVGLFALLLTNGCRRTPEPEPIPAPEMTNVFDEPALTPPMDTVDTLPTNDPSSITMAPETNVAPRPANGQQFGSPYTTYTPPVDPAPRSSGQEYTVVSGDSLSSIARKFPGVTVSALQEANPNVRPTQLRIGSKLQIPPPAPTAAAQTQPAVDGSGPQIYTVKSGDNLTTIAARNGTTVRALRSLNNLTTDRIRVGDKLQIPPKAPPAAPQYQTAPGVPMLTPPQ